jgi:hypothetical protein
MNSTKQKIVSLMILTLARLLGRTPQPGVHVVSTQDTILLVTPDGFSIALTRQALWDLLSKIHRAANPMGLPTQTLRENINV